MANDAAAISIRGNGWSGVTDTSNVDPTVGIFRRLENCYINRDGTEIRRLPGSRVAGYPGFCQEYPISTFTINNETTSTITLNTGVLTSAYLLGTGLFNGVFLVYIVGNTTIPDGVYIATRTGNTSFTFNFGSSTTGGGPNDGAVLIQRVQFPQALQHVDSRVVAIGETAVADTNGTRLRRNVGSAVSSGRMSFSSPAFPNEPEDPETGWLFWPSPTMVPINGSSDQEPSGGLSGAHNIDISHRIQADAQRGRVAIAVPGHGCLFEVNVRTGPPVFNVRPPTFDSVNIPNHRYTKALGIPRPVINNVNDIQGTASIVQGTPGSLLTGFYGFALGFYDPYTQEVGLASEVIGMSATSDNVKFDVQIPYPRSVMLECSGLAVVLFVSLRQDTIEQALSAQLFVHSFYGPFNPTNDKHAANDRIPGVEVSTLPDEDANRFPNRVPVLEQMHPGGSWVTFCKNRLFAGGQFPDFYPIHVFLYRNDPTGPNTDRFFLLHPDDDNEASVVVEPGPLAAGRIPHANAGYIAGSAQLFGSPALIGNTIQTTGGRSRTGFGGLLATEVDSEHGATASPTAGNETDYRLFTRPDIISFSEEKFPGVAPSTNRLTIDSMNANRVVAAARVGDALVAMTEYETVLYSWSSAPRNSSSQRVSNRYGCISPGSVAEGPFGAVWFSHEGPVMFNGSIRWIGRKIHELFRTIQRDEEGMMYYVHSAVDLEREMVVWSVRGPDDVDMAFELADTAGKRKIRGDMFLMWNYTQDTFSTATRFVGGNTQGLAMLPYDDGEMRLSWMMPARLFTNTGNEASEFRINDLLCPIYGWDDDAADRRESAIELTVASDRASNSDTIVVEDNIGEFDAGILYSSDEIYIKRPSNGELLFWGRVKWEAGRNSATNINLDDGAADGVQWEAGDIVVCSVIHMHMETHRLRFDDIEFDNETTGLAIECEIQDGTEAWARVRLEDEDGVITSLNDNVWGDPLQPSVTNFDYGNARTQGVRVLIDVISSGQVRVKDVQLKVHGG